MAATPAPVAGPMMNVDLHISCKNLRNADITSKSDPIAVVYTRRSDTETWTEVGRTEWITNNLNPSFTTAIRICYTFESTQYMRFVLYDVDDARANLAKADLLGEMETTLGTIVSAPEGALTEPLKILSNPKMKCGTITVLAEEVKQSNFEVVFSLAGRNLDKKDVFGKSDPYIVIKQKVGETLVPVHQTETIMNTLNPVWRPFTLSLQKLCGSDMNRTIIFDCFDWDKHSSPDQIGIVETTMNQLLQLASSGSVELPFINPKKASKRNYKNSGTLLVKQVTVTPIPTFLDYLRGGCEINLVTAVDFTASNGQITNPASLHYVQQGAFNQYELAISAVGSILSYYDRDGMIPAYGFGGSINGTVSHCFALNGNPTNPEVPGVHGILDAYHMAITQVGLSGPTYFAQVIHQTAEIICRNLQNPAVQKYYILLILTDGCIVDMAQTIREIVECANNLPLSIVIVGVGASPELKKMEELDADDHPLVDHKGNTAKRDIVQFVPFSKYASSPEKLAEETLSEIPSQLVSFMRSHCIAPLTPPAAPPMAAAGAPPMAAGAPPMAAAGASPMAAAGAPPEAIPSAPPAQ